MRKKAADSSGVNPLSSVMDSIHAFLTVESRLDAPQILINQDEAKPIEEGAALDYKAWLKRYAKKAAERPLAPGHEEAWDWIEDLSADDKSRPPAFLAIWPRGYGKSTTIELGVSRLSHTVKRRFVLYVSGTQKAADNHVASIANTMEELGIERSVNAFGYSKGWSGSRLRTANGFNVLAYGLDAHTRGVKLDNLRPDLIVLDDIDESGDSAEVVAKKLEAIRMSVLPAGSDNCAIFFAQNLIHAGSVISQIKNNEADILRKRLESFYPAIHNFEYEEYESHGRLLLRITGGQSSWPSKPLSAWEEQLNDFGIQAFLVECQHEVAAGGLFFRFQEMREGRQWHICDPFDIPDHWSVIAGHDYGTTAAACTYLAAVDEYGDVYAFAEEYKAGRESAEQAEAFIRICEMYKVEPTKVPIAFDWANTFPPNDVRQKLGEYPVEKWWARNLSAIMAVKDRLAGWANLRSWLHETRLDEETKMMVPRLRIMRGRCPNLVSFFQQAMADPKRHEDVSVAERLTHSGDAFRYCMMQRPVASLGLPSGSKRLVTNKGEEIVLPAGMDADVKREMEAILRAIDTGGEYKTTFNYGR